MVNKNQRKREFLTWLLTNFQHENPTVNYLLNYLRVQPDLIQYIHFSENVKYTPRGIYISYQQNTAVPFLYYKNKLSYTSCEQAFHDLRLNAQFTKERFYVELNIPNYYMQTSVIDIFEENPYYPLHEELSESLEEDLHLINQSVRLNQLRQSLDEALDAAQFETADYLINQIEQIKDDIEGELHED